MAKLAELLGTPLLPWQRYVVDVALEVDPVRQRWAYKDVVLTLPRQSGKTTLILPVALHRCGDQAAQVFYTAQSREVADDRWLEMTAPLPRHPVLGPRIKRGRGVGNRVLEWLSGGSFRAFSPKENAMHGARPDLVFVDEIWWFSDEQRRQIEGGYRPAWTVKPGQAWLTSTAGHQRSGWLKRARTQGRRAVETGQRSRTAYFDWSSPETVGGVPLVELDDVALHGVALSNHPRRDELGEDLAEDLWGELGRDRAEFIRFYANIDQDEAEGEPVISIGVLSAAFTPDRIPPGVRVAFGLHVGDGRRETSISAGWRDAGGRALTQVIESRPGSSWAADRVVELVRSNAGGNPVGAVAVLGAGPARGIADELERAGVPVMRVSATDYGAACGVVEDQLSGGRLTHDNDGRLLGAFRAAGWRRMGGSRVWASNTGEPITVLDAHTLAVWGFDHMPEPEPDRPPFKIH